MDNRPLTVAVLPDESLASVIARAYCLCGYHAWRQIYADIFGPRHQGFACGFPSRLGRVAEFLEGNLSGSDVLHRLTLWNGLSAFMLPADRECLSRKLIDARMHHCENGILQIKPRGRQSFRFCPVCGEEDVQACGVPYWHRSHQMPMVHVCWKHGVPLFEMDMSRDLQIIPLPPPPHATISVRRFGGHVDEVAKRYALMAHDILETNVSLDVAVLPKVYRAALVIAGLSKGLKLRYSDIAAQCEATQCRVEPGSLKNASRWLANLLYSHSANMTMNLMLATTLFNGWSPFIEAWKNYREEPPHSSKGMPRRREQPDKQALLEAFAEPRATLRSVANTLGWSTGSLRMRARYLGIPTASRKGRISERTRRAIEKDLCKGLPMKRIALHRNVSLSTVNGLRRSSASVDERRRSSCNEAERARHRRILKAYVNQHRSTRRSDIRNENNSLYLWFLKHDRPWFEMTLPAGSREHRMQERETRVER